MNKILNRHRLDLLSKFNEYPDSFSDLDLVELLLLFAQPSKNMRTIAQTLLKEFNSIAQLVTSPVSALNEINGIGKHTVSLIKFIYFLSLRIAKQKIETYSFSSIKEILDYCKLKMLARTQEELHAIFLNSKNILIADEILSVGSINFVQLIPRQVIKRSLDLGATSLFLIHNHPSGNITPSKEDIDLTKQLQYVLSVLNIKLHDHFIIAGNNHFSFLQNGLL